MQPSNASAETLFRITIFKVPTYWSTMNSLFETLEEKISADMIKSYDTQ